MGIEFRKCVDRWRKEGLMDRFLSGQHVLDIGFKGGDPETVPVTECAVGVGLDYPGYDGNRLPFDDETQDAVFSCAVLEHIPNYRQALSEWYRVTKIGGFLIILVPNRYLYEQRPDLPGRWNGDHRRFYTPASLLREIEESLPVNGFRIRYLLDNDGGFNYANPPGTRPVGIYQIETVVEKIKISSYTSSYVYPPHIRRLIEQYDQMVFDYIDSAAASGGSSDAFLALVGKPRYFTPWRRIENHFVFNNLTTRAPLSTEALKAVVRPLIQLVDVDVEAYVRTYTDLRSHPDPAIHWRRHGYFEGRLGSAFEFQFGG